MNKLKVNVLMMYIFNIGRMLFPFILMPYLTKIFSIETYALYVYVSAFLMYFRIFIDFGFNISGTRDIATANNNEDFTKIINNIVNAKIFLFIIGFLLLYIYIMITNDALMIEGKNFLFISCIEVFLEIFFLEFYFRGIEEMRFIAMRYFISRAISTILIVFLINSDFDLQYIPVYNIIGNLVAIYFVYKYIKKSINKFYYTLNFYECIFQLKQSINIFLYKCTTTIFSVFNTIIIGKFLDPMSIAVWGICLSIISGMQSLYNPIISALFPNISKSFNVILLRKILYIGIIICICVVLLMQILSSDIISIIADEKYIIGGSEILSIFSIMLVFSYPAQFIGHLILLPLMREKYLLNATYITSCFHILITCMLILHDTFSLLNIVILRCFTEAILLLVILLLILDDGYVKQKICESKR